MNRSTDIRPTWLKVWARRRALVAFAFAGALAGLVLGFVLPRWYRADTSLLPPSESDSGFGLVSLLRGLAVPGITVPTQATPADVFLAVLKSRQLNEAMIKRFDLQTLYKRPRRVDAMKELGRHARFKLTEAGTIDISVEDRDPKRAADMANAYVELLDHFNREVRMTKGRRMREFVEARMAETREQLQVAELKLAKYESKHRTAAISAQASSAIEAASRLYAQRAALQVRLGVVRDYSRAGSEEETQILQQLSALDTQLQAMPEIGLEQWRLVREAKTLEQVFGLLRAQYEEARLDEARNIATVEVLDPAVPPERHERPRKSILLAIGLVTGIAVGALEALFRDRLPARGPRAGAGD